MFHRMTQVILAGKIRIRTAMMTDTAKKITITAMITIQIIMIIILMKMPMQIMTTAIMEITENNFKNKIKKLKIGIEKSREVC